MHAFKASLLLPRADGFPLWPKNINEHEASVLKRTGGASQALYDWQLSGDRSAATLPRQQPPEQPRHRDPATPSQSPADEIMDQKQESVERGSITPEAGLPAESSSFKLSQANDAKHPLFILHDGPPYANGQLHLGHAMNKILKDIVVRHKVLRGNRVHFVPGWDCHGLPIELKALGDSLTKHVEFTPAQLRTKAAQFAREAMEMQRKEFMSWGVLGDWQHPYLTMTPSYEARQLQVFYQLYTKKLIYRGLKPVHWSPSTQTALAEAELEYQDNHVSVAAHVRFELPANHKAALLQAANWQDAGAVDRAALSDNLAVSMVVWTTTPWTIPSNQAIAINTSLDYSLLHVTEAVQPASPGRKWLTQTIMPSRSRDQVILVATPLVPSIVQDFATAQSQVKQVASISGASLLALGLQATHPLEAHRTVPIIHGSHVTADAGTGLVHTAPAHGVDDFIVCKTNNIPLLNLVDERGCYKADVAHGLAGLQVLTVGNAKVLELLEQADRLLLAKPLKHRYPYDWRSKKPVITLATKQWFASLTNVKHDALQAILGVELVPAVSRNRLAAMLGGRNDWCISRQRSWGVPIPVFYNKETGEPLLDDDMFAHIHQLVLQQGTDCWFTKSVAELLPASKASMAEQLVKGTDTMDVWFDSGTSWMLVQQLAAQQQQQQQKQADKPAPAPVVADLVLEGSDQHRGWFQSSLLTSVIARGVAPFKTIVTHGFLLDERGRKMSKSLGNVVEPARITHGGSAGAKGGEPWTAAGTDVLRAWAASADYSADVVISKDAIKAQTQIVKKIRNTFRYLLGNLHDFDPAKHLVPLASLRLVDRVVLQRTSALWDSVQQGYESYAFARASLAITTFCNVELSGFYFELSKDRLYAAGAESPERRAAQTVLYHAVVTICKAVAPVLCHLADEVWSHLQGNPEQSVLLGHQAAASSLGDVEPSLAAAWPALLNLRAVVNRALQVPRFAQQIGSPLDADVTLELSPGSIEALQTLFSNSSASLEEQLAELFITSQVRLVDRPEPASARLLHTQREELEGLGPSVTPIAVHVSRAALHKCPRCWRFTAQEPAHLCQRCAKLNV
ncbi:isoleucyl-tRNA synthetase [Capsaspora owczarzaki ATCC 30864]|nr:isoleucyl-tRNA synthetase [Capsaspora owczarzaki ATCC 30864]|eukprot:XP_004343303.1 isoleucyl-tRNA synthetase [Capsaspora owczarzaki ATCC 30864]